VVPSSVASVSPLSTCWSGCSSSAKRRNAARTSSAAGGSPRCAHGGASSSAAYSPCESSELSVGLGKSRREVFEAPGSPPRRGRWLGWRACPHAQPVIPHPWWGCHQLPQHSHLRVRCHRRRPLPDAVVVVHHLAPVALPVRLPPLSPPRRVLLPPALPPARPRLPAGVLLHTRRRAARRLEPLPLLWHLPPQLARVLPLPPAVGSRVGGAPLALVPVLRERGLRVRCPQYQSVQLSAKEGQVVLQGG
jgi:hypothetical protein